MILDVFRWSGRITRTIATSLLVIALGMAVDADRKVTAQVTSDNTLSTTVTSSDSLNFVVEDGHRAGNNLFHSFESFSVPTNGSVHFENTVDMTNIFSRITGDSLSAIDGLIQVDGSANLFLLNPNGILFGEEAALDINGSFLATTADRFLFDGGAIFSASELQDSALLSINVPTGIQFGSTAEGIVNRSQVLDSDFGWEVGLQVPAEQSLTLLGGLIDFDYGMVTTEGGHVNLGAVAPESVVSLDTSPSSWVLGYEQAPDFQDILFTGTNGFGTYDYDEDFLFTSVDTSGYPGGNIDLRGRQILLDGAGLIADTWDVENGDNQITLHASERVVLDGEPDDTDSVIRVSAFGEGRGGGIVIDSPILVLRSTGNLYTETSDAGTAGDVRVEVDQLSVEDYAYLGSETYGMGNAGNLTIVAEELFVDSSYISSGAYSSGQAGDITITAQDLVATNRAEVFNEAVEGGGDAGLTQITVDRLVISGGSEIGSGSSDGGGDAGTVIVQASESITIQGTEEFSDPILGGELALIGSAIFSITDQGEGDGGDIRIETPLLQLSDGGTIGANTFSQGNSGNVTIRAERIDISESGIGDPGFQDRFGITSTVERGSTGTGGNIDIVTDQLNIVRGGSISSNSLGEGNAGNISIQARAIDVQGRLEEVPLVGGEVLNQPLLSQIASFSESDFAAGSVNIRADLINVGDRAKISVSNLGQGDSGTLLIQADSLQLDGRSGLQADVNGGGQGNIYLTIRDVLSLYDNSSITANATDQSTGGNINITAKFIIAPPSGNSDISANAEASFGGNTAITTEGLFGIKIRPQATRLSDITASSALGVGFEGTVEIESPETEPGSQTVELPETLVDVSQLILAGCAVDEGEFVLTGRGGLPSNPLNVLASTRAWVDLRSLVLGAREVDNLTTVEFSEAEQNPIQEATGIAIAPDGTRQLVASSAQNSAISHPTCSAHS